jgi:hypothetical protein
LRQCFGITRNLTRCNRIGTWKLFCREHRRQPLVWLTFIIFTVIAGTASIYSALQPTRMEIPLLPGLSPPKPENGPSLQVTSPQISAKPSIPEPVIACILDDHPVKKGFLLFTVKNEGPTPARSVSVDCLTMRYLKKEQKIRLIMGESGNKFEYNEPGRNWMFIPQLEPNAVSSKLTGESVWPEETTCVNILYFRTTFLTPELASREKTCVYLIEGDRIYSFSEYKTNKHYAIIDREINRTLAENVPNFHMLGKHRRQ